MHRADREHLPVFEGLDAEFAEIDATSATIDATSATMGCFGEKRFHGDAFQEVTGITSTDTKILFYHKTIRFASIFADFLDTVA